MKPRLRLWLHLPFLVLCLGGSWIARADGLSECRLPDLTEPARCGVVSVPENPALWFTEHAAQGFPNRAEVVLTNRGHTEYLDCVMQIYRDFVTAGAVAKLDTSTCKPEPRRPFQS